MPVLKTNWLSRNAPGWLLLIALILTTFSFWYFQAQTNAQKIAAIALLALLIAFYGHKFPWKILICLFLIFLIRIKIADPVYQPKSLAEVQEVVIYPDQIKIKDNWFSGVANGKKGKVLVSGNITSDQQKLLQNSCRLLLTSGMIEEIMPATNLGQFDYRKYYAGQGISRRIKLKAFKLTKAPSSLASSWHQVRAQFLNWCEQLPFPLGFFTSELILAEPSGVNSKDVLNNYRNLGVIHLLSISGQHVLLYTLVISLICFWLKLTEGETLAICSLFLAVGILLSDFQPGFVRASGVFVIGRLLKLQQIKIAGVDLLGMVCLLHLICFPRLFQNTGAQLSYLAALGLHLTNNLPKLWQSFGLNILLWPILLTSYYQINILTVLFNLPIALYFDFLVMPMVYLNLLISPWIQVAGLFNGVLGLVEKWIGRLAESSWGLLNFGMLSWWQCLGLIILTAGALILTNSGSFAVQRKKLWSLIVVCYLAFYLWIHFPPYGQVTLIDVGQGDSILITTPFIRKSYLIDVGGKVNFSGKKTEPQVNAITIPFLRAQGIDQLDAIFLSHQDADHVGDLAPLMKQIKVKRLYVGQGMLNNPSFVKRLSYAQNTEKIEVLAGMKVNEQIPFKIVYPFTPGSGKNEDSLSLLFNLAGKNWLFTGDLPQAGEKAIMERYNFQVDYFKLGHHGSKTSTDPGFMQKLQPKLCFISAGRQNRFGHPHPETITTLKNLAIPWVSTQDCGMISWYYGLGQTYFRSYLKGDWRWH